MTDETTPAAPEQGQAAPAPETGQGAGNSFLDSFEGDMRGYMENKGFQDANALADGYRNLEKLRGVPAEQIMQLPADMSDAESMQAVYDRLGRPEGADKYTNVLGDSFDDNVYKAVSAKAHDLGLNDAQFQGLQSIMAEQSQGLVQAQEEQAAQAFDQWKGQNEDGFNKAAKLMADVGVTEEGLEGLLAGDKTALYDFMAKVGGRTGEQPVIQGDAPSSEAFNMTPHAAKMKVQELLVDDAFMKAYMSDNQKIRQPAIDRMSKLNEIAAKA